MQTVAQEPETRHKVLVIDDEMGPRESLRILLKPEYDVRTETNVDDGVAALVQEQPDIVVMDIRMPGKSGIEGLREVRSKDPNVSVVMLTGYGALETAQQAIRLGADDYLKKPFDTSEMVAVIRRYVRRTQLARKRASMSEELRNLNNRLVEDLTVKEHMASLGRASSELVHDLRNPLTVVHGYAQLLAEELDTVKERLGQDAQEAFEYLEIIGNNIERCTQIMEMWRHLKKDTLDDRQPVRVNDIVTDLIRSAEPVAASASASLRHISEDGDLVVLVDSLQIFRALQNLVTNAIQSLPEREGEVRVVTRRDDTTAEILVEDNGCGIEPHQLKHVFDPCFTTKQRGEGTGLGLSITKKVVEQHGGEIHVASAPGRGTCFTMRLPATPPTD